MNSTNTPESQSEPSGGLSPAAKWGLWGCGGCATVLSAAILIGGLALAQYLRQHSDSLEKIYQRDTTPALMEQPGGWVRTLTAEWMITTSVAWSPDGQRLAMCAMPKIAMRKFFRMPPPMMFDPRRQGEAGMKWVLKAIGPQVVIIDVTADEEKTILGASEGLLEWPEEVVWLPDGQRLAVVTSPMPTKDSDEERLPPRLWVLSADGSKRQPIGEGAMYLDVSADGKWIAYLREVPGNKEHPLAVVPADGGSEILVSEQSVIEMTWHKQENVLYFRCRTEPKQWWRVRIPDASPKTMPVQIIEATDRTVLDNVDFVGVYSYEDEKGGERKRYRLCVLDLAASRRYVVSPFFDTPATALGPCLENRYILVRSNDYSLPTGHHLWVYRLADNKFYQITDDPKLKASLQKGYSPVDTSGTRVYLEHGPLVPDVWKIFTTGFSTPVMLLRLDEKKILSQPGQDEPVVVSSQHQGANQ